MSAFKGLNAQEPIEEVVDGIWHSDWYGVPCDVTSSGTGLLELSSGLLTPMEALEMLTVGVLATFTLGLLATFTLGVFPTETVP